VPRIGGILAGQFAGSFSRLIHGILLGINGVESLYPISVSRTEVVSVPEGVNGNRPSEGADHAYAVAASMAFSMSAAM
jgi:hypothetical protein